MCSVLHLISTCVPDLEGHRGFFWFRWNWGIVALRNEKFLGNFTLRRFCTTLRHSADDAGPCNAWMTWRGMICVEFFVSKWLWSVRAYAQSFHKPRLSQFSSRELQEQRMDVAHERKFWQDFWHYREFLCAPGCFGSRRGRMEEAATPSRTGDCQSLSDRLQLDVFVCDFIKTGVATAGATEADTKITANSKIPAAAWSWG